MWKYYQSQSASNQSSLLESDADNSRVAATYQNMINELQGYANRITTPDVRADAEKIVIINRTMFEQWKRWAGESQSESSASIAPTRADQEFSSGFAQSAAKLKTAHSVLENDCRS
jgi:hypothetical protein